MPSAGFTLVRVGALALAIMLVGLLFPGLFAPFAVSREPKTVRVWNTPPLAAPVVPAAAPVTHRDGLPHVKAEVHAAPHDSEHGK